MFRDRTTIIVVALAAIGLILSLFWQSQDAAKRRAYYEAQRVEQPIPSPSAMGTPAPAMVAPPPVAQPVQPSVPEQTSVLRSPVAELRLSNLRGGLATVELLQHKAEDDLPVELDNRYSPAIGAVTQNPNDWTDTGYNLTSDQEAGTATLQKETSDSLETTKVFTLGSKAGLKDEYQIKLTITFRNRGASDYTSPGYFVGAGASQPIHRSDQSLKTEFDWYRDGKFRSINVGWFNPSSIFGLIPLSAGHEVYSEASDHILWAAVASQYFTTILGPADKDGSQVWARRIRLPATEGAQAVESMQGALGLPGFTLHPGESKSADFTIYAGPKEYARLARLSNDEAAVMNFGWLPWLSKILLAAMNTLHVWVGSYALAIIILTIIIRGLLWPLQNASMKSMRKMSRLSPLVNELKAKYKDDPQRMNQEMMKLYKDYGVNPVAGCLPMFVQIPVFFSFYAMLGSAIELRNSSFLWVRDLSQPDTVGHLFGFPINILPLVMAGAQVWQMQVTPKSGDPAQQRILYFTPLLFLFFCYNYASGLALYWTVSTVFTIVQTYLTRNQTAGELKKVPKPLPVAKKRSYR